MCIKSRILAYCHKKNIAISRFESLAGLSNGYFNQVKKRPSLDKIEMMGKAFPDLNTDWVLTGEGEMLKDGSMSQPKSSNDGASETATTVLLLPVYAIGGSLNDFVASVSEYDCERVVSPIGGVDFAIQVSGDSMSPEYPNGSRIFIKKINEKAFIEWGKTYVLDTCNGTVVKRIVPSDRDGYIRCVSINPDPVYAPFEVSLSDVFGMYKVLLCMSVK